MLALDPHSRYTAEQCLEHPWINGDHYFDYVSYKRYLQYDRFARKWHWFDPPFISDADQEGGLGR